MFSSKVLHGRCGVASSVISPSNSFEEKEIRPQIFDYRDLAERALDNAPDDPRFLPCVMPNWDTTPRSGIRGLVFKESTPEAFRGYLQKAFALLKTRPDELRICFVKAWNEWAEGNYLEPDLRFGARLFRVYCARTG